MSFSSLAKHGAQAFFVTAGILGLLHYVLGWPDDFNRIWIIAMAGAIGAVLSHAWRARNPRTEK